MERFEKIAHLIDSDKYQKVLQEISEAIDNSVQSIPFVEPQLCQFIEDSVAMQLLETETDNNTAAFDEVLEIYRSIIEDVLLALLEGEPLEEKKEEMLKELKNTAFSKLLERYEISQREEASVIARYREQVNGAIDDTTPLQTAVYEIEGANRKLRKELKTLDLQLKRTTNDLEQERRMEVDDFDENDPRIEKARELEEQLAEVTEQISKGEQLKAQLDDECEEIQQQIDTIMEQLVAMDKRSVRNVRKTHK